jgi:bifunctional non-homologous end joining protein LigD
MTTRSYGRRSVETSNEDKVLFPGIGLTKGDLIDYYERIADEILPHLRDRALVVQRFPDGIDAEGFYQKQVESHTPDWIETVRVDVASTGEKQELVVCNGRATLGHLANQACIALHPWLSRVDDLDRPDTLVVDLDPPTGDFDAARRAALRVRALFDELEIACFAKLTGSQGVHVFAPLDGSADFEAARGFAQDAMAVLAARHPDDLTTEQRTRKRGDRVYLDVGRNSYAQTAVAAWSVRPLPGAPVSAPISWSDLEHPGIGPRDFTVENVFRRIAQRDDPWAGWRRHARSLARPRERLARLREP